MYYIKRLPDGVIGGLPFINSADAIREANKLCTANNREVHYEVLKMESVYVTSTIDEAMAEPSRTLADRPRVPSNFKD